MIQSLARKARKAVRHPSLVRNRIKRALSDRRLDAWLGRGKAFSPSTVYLIPTLRCNLDCATCGIRRNVFQLRRQPPGTDFREEMSWTEWLPVLDQIGAFKPTVILSGGEPLMSPVWLPMVQHLAHRHGVFVGLATNGVGLDRVLPDAVRAGVRHFHVSVDGWGVDFEAIRGEGSFSQVRSGLEALARIRRDAGDGAPGLSIVSVVNSSNLEGLPGMLLRLRELGIDDLLVQHLVRFTEVELQEANGRLRDPLQRACWTWGERVDPMSIDRSLLRETVARMRSIARQAPRVGLRFVPDLDRFGYEAFYSPGPMPRVPGFHCNLFWKATYVFPDGSLIPAHFCHFRPVGNLRRQGFASLWNGLDYRRIRRNIRSERWLSLCGYCFQPYGGCI